MTIAERITDPVAQHGEGPVWQAGCAGLRWVDMLVGDVLTLDGGTVYRQHVGSLVAALRPRLGGGVVLALERGFALADDELNDIRHLGELWSDKRIRMNEGACAPDGSFYCGSMAYDATTGASSLYRLDPTGSVTTVLDGLTVSNGLAWSPDGATAYYVDTPTQRIDAFDYVDGALTNRHVIASIAPESGAPDGLTVDSTGGLWAALWGGGVVHHYSNDGRLLDVIEVGVPGVTACTFGGANLDQLFITTSRVETDVDTYPQAGAVFRARQPVRGLPALPYDGRNCADKLDSRDYSSYRR